LRAGLAQLRRVCRSLAGASEVSAWGHPTFRAGSKAFAAFETVQGRSTVAIWLGVEDADVLLHEDKRFFATPYGRGQWVSIFVDKVVPWGLLRSLAKRGHARRLEPRIPDPRRPSHRAPRGKHGSASVSRYAK
jgi:predicted DNA-binding protein (MmcQ/YjbR family)